MARTSEAERFRVERAGPFEVSPSLSAVGWLVIATSAKEMAAWLHREGFFVDGTAYHSCVEWRRIADGVHFPTQAEAQFRLLLYTDPRQALQPFLEHDAKGGIISYEGTCGECGGYGKTEPGPKVQSFCDSCHGTGGPPAEHLLCGAADWFGERGEETQASVLRSLINAKGIR